MQVRLTKDQKIQIAESKDLYGIMQRILKRQGKIRSKQEYLWLIGLETDATISFIELLSTGSLNNLPLEPREVFRIAVIKNVARIILVHNHPSGNVKPSTLDKTTTKKLSRSGYLLGIDVVDHLIITPKEYFSFRDNGIKMN